MIPRSGPVGAAPDRLPRPLCSSPSAWIRGDPTARIRGLPTAWIRRLLTARVTGTLATGIRGVTATGTTGTTGIDGIDGIDGTDDARFVPGRVKADGVGGSQVKGQERSIVVGPYPNGQLRRAAGHLQFVVRSAGRHRRVHVPPPARPAYLHIDMVGRQLQATVDEHERHVASGVRRLGVNDNRHFPPRATRDELVRNPPQGDGHALVLVRSVVLLPAPVRSGHLAGFGWRSGRHLEPCRRTVGRLRGSGQQRDGRNGTGRDDQHSSSQMHCVLCSTC
ncbi:hypothetical protein DWB77_00268 [Streptomyces hundungensis]|uniref:Uncharacterized protein n=1 Tax=Streptomyces hundungensis TaxID=1077946 RepID=A0A387H6I6_9ACTN|nr:hypothetical protein DWB77_00268 [Streptomyces hundungensis]